MTDELAFLRGPEIHAFVGAELDVLVEKFAEIDSLSMLDDVSKDFRKLEAISECAAAIKDYPHPDDCITKLVTSVIDGIDIDRVAKAIAWGEERAQIARESIAEPPPRRKATEKMANGHDSEAGVELTDFYAYMPQHKYIYIPTGELWPAVSIDKRLKSPVEKMSASTWIDRNRPVEQMTWAPGQPRLIHNRLVNQGGWFDREGVACFNLYREPDVVPGDPADVKIWLDHIKKIYGIEQGTHIIYWLAQRVQHPEEKINHALVLGGSQGIGKDTLLEPVKYAVGPWNFAEVSPTDMLGRFNGFSKSVILRISEARNLGDVDRFKLYEMTKSYIVSPPDVISVEEKYVNKYAVFNITGVIITTNYRTDCLYLPREDRRHYVAWSECKQADFDEDYWRSIWGFYDNGGLANVAAYLMELDISEFNPKAPPPKTEAFWSIVNAGHTTDDAELSDIIESAGRPDAITIDQLIQGAPADGAYKAWLQDRKNRRAIPHHLERAEYVAVRNPEVKEGTWKIAGKRQVIYAKMELSFEEQCQAARNLRDRLDMLARSGVPI